ncbi:hypothetical protein ACJJIF_13425 [Microbulbifer sp. SSSA002]|uniref:hypothetical protein n=1 Tax=Microbulbifer sp. SSSA002 TaxID=3243376 RepID=UPI0040397C5A
MAKPTLRSVNREQFDLLKRGNEIITVTNNHVPKGSKKNPYKKDDCDENNCTTMIPSEGMDYYKWVTTRSDNSGDYQEFNRSFQNNNYYRFGRRIAKAIAAGVATATL